MNIVCSIVDALLTTISILRREIGSSYKEDRIFCYLAAVNAKFNTVASV